jgi:hypothetical protein
MQLLTVKQVVRTHCNLSTLKGWISTTAQNLKTALLSGSSVATYCLKNPQVRRGGITDEDNIKASVFTPNIIANVRHILLDESAIIETREKN